MLIVKIIPDTLIYEQKMSGFSRFEAGGTYSNNSCTFKALNNFVVRFQNLGHETGKLVTINPYTANVENMASS